MHELSFCKLAAVFLIGLGMTAATAQDAPKLPDGVILARVLPEEIEKIVKQLGSNNGKTRELATKAILNIGEDALPHLEFALTKADSLELKRRTEGLYAEISAKIQPPKLPGGVIHVRLPPGEVRLEDVRDGRSLLRVTVGKTFIEAQTVFLGDGKGATRYDAMMAADAIKGGNVVIFGVASSIQDEGFVPLSKLKAGSLYITTPSIIFRWGKDTKLNP